MGRKTIKIFPPGVGKHFFFAAKTWMNVRIVTYIMETTSNKRGHTWGFDVIQPSWFNML
jgi:hypothetical protein